jgi:hypothetical protein
MTSKKRIGCRKFVFLVELERVAGPDRKLNALFLVFVRLLRDKKIYKNRRLLDPDDGTSLLRGYLTSKRDIFLSFIPSCHCCLAKTLIHELLHEIYERMPEREILLLEESVWSRLTVGQRHILSRFIPRHFVKKQPPQPTFVFDASDSFDDLFDSFKQELNKVVEVYRSAHSPFSLLKKIVKKFFPLLPSAEFSLVCDSFWNQLNDFQKQALVDFLRRS